MTEFWGIIGENELRTEADVEATLERVSARLAPLPTYDLLNFVDGLHEALSRLDRRQFAEIPVFVRDLAIPQSEDGFQYARCACVLAGRRVFEEVPATGEGFEPFTVPELPAERLLYLADEHYEDKMGFPMERRRTFPIDMKPNPDGWN
ncbi:DUF4240 domain-containing protein [Lentzea nigeriaca]|uniref:DUF4240 domain-containing protein n=1 Tax=Lentzea nigeriaca TaxID=1128665 RepID=UPI00195E9382|nr:DUF4240 domain-containing protein [Lentzea nigeriaca]MBM7861008.1 hypothetical protein [Lentzea nigeriaca]